ncbi:uncharacterized protein LOC113464969 [Ceratina calcarata]|uniref:Uncharacterized protein LOC113464969 n=1 Tax=Ceratina calcarata TaxID=156304 RepID=A0AAJ7S909_9HYME|nr:uncharacterized protein LOC113464969 [Ceratina calcarata]
MHAGCYFKIPQNIRYKRATITIESGDNACFAWAVVAALYPVARHTERPSSYPHYNTVLNFGNIEFPISLNQIRLFERLNDVSINVYGIENHHMIAPLYLTSEKKNRHANLLYVENHQNSTIPGHFACIKNLSRLVSSQLSKKKSKKFICDRCLHYFCSSQKLETHTIRCKQMNDCAIVLPNEEDKWLKFQNYFRKERLPFVVYADLECILEKMTEQQNQNSYPYQHHKVFSIGYYIQCSYDISLSRYECYRGVDCVSWFVQELQYLAHFVKDILSISKPMDSLSPEQWNTFTNATLVSIVFKMH